MKRTLWAVLLTACGGAAAEGPLTVPLGMNRDQLASELRRHEYCTDDQPPVGKESTEVIKKCDVPGAEFGQSWVVAHYDEAGRVQKLQRWERYSEEPRALERFNHLIEKRAAQAGGPTDAAKKVVEAQQELPAGTKSWVAFEVGEQTLVGVYLLEPRPPEYATILEEILERR